MIDYGTTYHQMDDEMFQDYLKRGSSMDEEIRAKFKIPKNRYYSVTVPPSPAGRILVDPSRTRTVRSVKLSKSL